MRAVVVLPFVPVTAAIGMLLGVSGGNSMSITGPATSRGVPSLGATCMRNPGPAFTSQMPPPACAIRFRNVPCQEIDAADVEVDGADGANRHLAVVGMNDVGDIDRRATGREIGRRSQVNDFAFCRYRVLVVTEFRQQSFCLVIELQARQHFLVTNAATRILVHDFNEPLDRLSLRRRQRGPARVWRQRPVDR